MISAQSFLPAGLRPESGRADLVYRLTLLGFLLQPVGFWAIRPVVVALSVAGLLSRELRLKSGFWLTFFMLTAARIVEDWPMSDNHAYLLSYWCLALYLSRRLPRGEEVLALNGRWLIAGVFTLAVIWKAALSPDYLDGRFFRITLLTDDRFADLVLLAGGMTERDLEDNRDALEPFPAGAEPASRPQIYEPPAFQRLATLTTWATLGLEGLLALAFLVPGNSRLGRARDWVLLGFCASCYALAPVIGFGQLLLILGLAQCESRKASVRLAYLATFALLIFYREVPWTALWVEQLYPYG